MIRGRHRGLPVAIDRAIVLPYEFEKAQDNPDPLPGIDERRSSRYSVGAFSHHIGGSTDNVEHGQTTAEKQRVGEDEVGEERGRRARDEQVER